MALSGEDHEYLNGFEAGKKSAAAEIARLRAHNAALVETVRASLCPYNGRATGVIVGECQQCGCTSGLMIRPLNVEQGAAPTK